MGAFVIFWAAVLAIICFLLGNIFKALASGFSALLSSLVLYLSIGFLTVASIAILSLIYGITDGIITGGLGNAIGSIVFFIVVIGFLFAIFGGLGLILLELIMFVVNTLLTFIDMVLTWAADLFERGYKKSLRSIKNQLEKC